MKKKLLSLTLLIMMAINILPLMNRIAFAEDLNLNSFTVPDSWENDGGAYTAEDLPGDFVECTVDQAKAWAASCSDDAAVLIINTGETNNVYLKMGIQKDTGSFTRAGLYNSKILGYQIYYASSSENQYQLWVGKTQVNSKNAKDVLGDGKVSYDADNNILALNGAVISDTNNYGAAVYTENGLIINLEDRSTNTIETSAGNGIVAGSLKIQGNGALTVSAGGSWGIAGSTVNIAIGNDAEVTVTGNDAAISGNVVNAVEGTGWSNVEGSENQTHISTRSEGQALSFKRVQFPSVEHIHDEITFMAWTSASSLPDKPGNYYLTKDVTLDAKAGYWDVPAGTTKLCLNGHTIAGSSAYPAIYISSGGIVLDLYNAEDETGIITHSNGEGGGVRVNFGSTFNMYGGTISGNSPATGGGVYVEGGTFNMYGGTISNNTAASSYGNGGGGVYIVDGTFNMYGGTISKNSSAIGGGVSINGGTFNMNGGTVSDNTAENGWGGGVCVVKGAFIMNSGAISRNKAYFGGGVSVFRDSFTMTGGTISDNTAAKDGGGVSYASGSFDMSGGEIKNNTAAGIGGGIDVCGNVLKLSGKVTITGNTAANASNNVYLYNDDSETRISLTAALDESSSVGISMDKMGVFAQSTTVKASDYLDNFFSDDETLMILEAGDELKLSNWKDDQDKPFRFIPAAETLRGKNDGSITINDPIINMEYYRVLNDGSRSQVADVNTAILNNLAPGTYYFRYKETDTLKPSGYTSVVIEEGRKISIAFRNDDGTLLQQFNVLYNVTPQYTGKTPVKQNSAEYTYTFKGWDKDVGPATADTVYTAVFEQTRNSYTITFVDEDGSLIDKQQLEYGRMPVHDDPIREMDRQYIYTFKGWNPALSTVTGDAEYRAVYDREIRQYTIKWQYHDASESVLLDYGTLPKHADPPGYRRKDLCLCRLVSKDQAGRC